MNESKKISRSQDLFSPADGTHKQIYETVPFSASNPQH